MDKICKRYLESFQINSDGCFSGFVKGEEKYESFLLDLTTNGFNFSRRNSRKLDKDSRLFFTESGFPCSTYQNIYLKCCHGDQYYEINKSSKNENHPSGIKRRFHIQNTKKIGCPAKMNVKIRLVYPEYQLHSTTPTKWMKIKMSLELKSKITQDDVRREPWYFIDGLVKHSHEINSSSAVKRYNHEVPTFLHNRPHKFIRHMMPRYQSAQMEFTKEDCVQTSELEARIFNKDTKNAYTVDFAHVRCSCPDFERWQTLCKHFCACFLHIPQLPFEALPEEFKENPLNRIVLTKDRNLEENHEFYQQSERLLSVSCQKPSNQLALIRKELKCLINITYNVDEGVCVDNVLKQISVLRQELDSLKKKEAIPNRKSKPLKSKPLKRKRDESSNKMEQSVLPQPQKQKHKNEFQGRVGKSAEMWRTALNCDLDEMSVCYFVTV